MRWGWRALLCDVQGRLKPIGSVMFNLLHKLHHLVCAHASRGGELIGDRDLAALRRHQRRLLFGGGGLLSAVILGALLAVAALRVQDFQAGSVDEFDSGRLALDALLAHRAADYERSLNMTEYTWRHRREGDREASRAQRMRFLTQQERALISADGNSTPQLALGLHTDRWTESRLEYYLDLTDSLSAIAPVSSREGEPGLGDASYFYDPSGQFFVLSRGFDEQSLRQGVGANDRAGLFAKLKAMGDKSVTGDRGASDIRTFHGQRPDTGEPAIVSAFEGYDDGKLFGTFVTFDSTERLVRILREASDDTFMLISRDGQLILSTQPITDSTMDITALATAGARTSRRSGLGDHWLRGRFFITQTVGGTDWLLVLTYTWRDILREIWRGMVWDSLIAAMTLIGLWSLLVRMDRHVFAPAIAKASRVYQSEEVSRTLVEMAPVGLCLIDADDGSVVLENDLAGRYAADVEREGGCLHRYLLDDFATALSMPPGLPQAREFELVIPGAEEGVERELSVVMARAIYQNRPVFLCAMRDRTARAELERQQQRARQEAEAVARAKSTFVAAMSHEIRTPFQGIIGHLELLGLSRLDDGQRERLRHVKQSADSLLSIINDILDFSKIESGQLDIERVPFEPRALVERVALLFAPLAQARGLDLDFRLDASVGPCYEGDMTRIEQVLRNLVSNALKFTPSGRIAVRVAPERLDAGEALRFEVVDSGVGLLEEQRQRLFEPFVQADGTVSRRFGGTGLGLYLCRRLCELMGGSIEVSSTMGVGSAFSFEVPVTRLEASPRQAPLLGLRAVVVSSATKWRDELGQRLAGWGCEVRLAADTSELEPQDVEHAAVLVAFERSGQDWDPDGAWRPLVRQLIRVRGDGPLSPVWMGNATVVSCYSGEALLQALQQCMARQASWCMMNEQPIG